jgi:hypothetical protein
MPPCQLVLRTPARVFEREVTVAARSDRPGSRAPGGWQVLAWRSWRHADPEREAPPLAIDLPSVASTDARLILDEGDNQPLPLERPVLELRTWRLRFVRETGDGLWLVYGRRDLAAPKYDLELRETRLKQEAAHEVVAEPEPSPAARGAWGRPATVFWTALVAAVIALLALLARLLRPGAESTGPQA